MRSATNNAMRGLAGVVLLLATLANPIFAQSDTGRIEGVVTDAQGASVAGADVVVTNVETNEALRSTTNGDGYYVATPLKAGKYSLEISAQSFKKYEQRELVLQVNQVARIDAALEAGAITETVEITEGAPLVDASTSSLGAVIDEKKIVDLPLNGRNFTQLATLVPGVNRGTLGGIASGASNNTETFRQQDNGGASISANGVREQSNNFLLDGIDNNETIVNTIVFFPPVEALQEFRVITVNAPAEFGRAGGAIISAVYKSGQNAFHGSVFEFIRNSALDARPTFATRKEVFIRNQYGFTFGGPIVKDKTFFFGDFQGLRERRPIESGNFVTVPTLAMRSGDFSELLDPSISGLASPVQIVNPANGNPYPGNIIPSSDFDAAGLAFLNAYPIPTRAGVVRNFEPGRVRQGKFDDGDVRIDHRFNDANTIFGRFSIGRDRASDAGRIPGFQAGFGAGTNRVAAESFAFNYTSVLTPTLINEFRYGYIHGNTQFLPIAYGTDQDAALGIGGLTSGTTTNGISLIGAGDGTYFEYLGSGGEFRLNERSHQFSDTVTWTHGSHTAKLGATVVHRDVQGIPSDFASLGFYFYSDLVAFPGTTVPLGQTGYPVADVLAGRTNFTVADLQDLNDPPTTISWENGFFAQDDWRVSRRLTLNLGLRYEVFTPYYEKEDRLANFDPATQTLVLPNTNGFGRSTVDTDWNNFGPRVGFAYDLTGDTRTILRGAYGVFYSLDRGGVGNQLTKNSPFFVQNYSFGGANGSIPLSQPIVVPAPVDPSNPVIPNGNTVIYIPADTQNERIQQYNVTFERQLGDDLAASAAYVGTRGDNLNAVLTSGQTFTDTLLNRVTTVANEGASRYNSLQLRLQQRDWHGWGYIAAYTYGHVNDNTPGPLPGPGYGQANATDPNNLDLDKGRASFDIRQRFTFATTYAIGDFHDYSRAARYLLGDWQVNGILTIQSGNPFTVFDANNRRAIISGDPYADRGDPDDYLDVSAFSPATSATDQQLRNAVDGPRVFNLDGSLFRRFAIAERVTMEFRAEFFNVFNHPQYGVPVQRTTDPNFGRVLSIVNNSERQVQFGLRFVF